MRGQVKNHDALTASGLTKSFGQFLAVDHIDLTIERGRIFGFLGPNGAGKTTTIRMLLGLLAPTAGTATVLGFDIVKQAEEIRQRIGYMSQKFSLYSDLTVEENLNFFGGTYGVRGMKLIEKKAFIIKMAGLEGKEHLLTGKLSGGWKQRLALGTAIIHEPEMLFLDEPTAGVDPISRRTFWEMIYQLAENGTTIMVTTHYMDEAEHCQELAFIQYGRLVANGSPSEVKEKYMKGDVIEIDCQQPEKALPLLRSSRIFDELSLYGSLIHAVSRQSEEHISLIRKILVEANIEVRAIDIIAPSLEDVFIASARPLRSN